MFLSYKRFKLKLRVVLAGHIVAMVTYYAKKLTATCSPMIGQFVDTIGLVWYTFNQLFRWPPYEYLFEHEIKHGYPSCKDF